MHVTGREAGADPGFWAQKVSTCACSAYSGVPAANRLASHRLAVARARGGGGGGGGGAPPYDVHIGYVPF